MIVRPLPPPPPKRVPDIEGTGTWIDSVPFWATVILVVGFMIYLALLIF